MGDSASDSELLQASLGGSKEAFGRIVQRYQTLVCSIAYSATGDVGASEELAQETFIRAWRSLRQLQDMRKFRPWLCTIARNLVSRRLRHRSRDIVAHAAPLGHAETLAAAESGPGQAAIAAERREVVWSALREVPEEYREPMVLFYRRQRSVRQVAADLDLSEEAVRQRLRRGRQLIKAQVSSLVEDVLAESGPSKAFTVAVVAALPALTAQTASAAVAGVVARSTKGVSAAKTLFAGGLSGAVLGPILGVLGGIFGAWCSIRNTRSPRERRFMIRMTILVWLLLVLCIGLPLTLALAGLIPKWAYWLSFGLFFVLLLPLIFWANARQRRIQMEDGTYCQPTDCPSRPPKQPICPNFGGAIFGSQIWVLLVAAATKDWLSALMVMLLAGLVFLASLRVFAGRPERYLRAGLVALLGVGAIDLGVVCLRWRAWQSVAGFDEFGGNVPLWLVALLIAVSVAVMALGIVWLERKRSAAPAQRPAEDASSSASGASRAGIYGPLAGTIFGSTGWLFMMSLTARDWVAVVVVIYAVVVFTLSARSCIAHRRRMWPVLLIDVAALYALYLVVLNLRWGHWMANSGHPSPYARVSLTYVNVAVTLIVAALALLIGRRGAADRQRHTTEK